MYSKSRLSNCCLMLIAVCLFICIGSACLTHAQGPLPSAPAARNPPVKSKYLAHGSKPSGKRSPEEVKHEAIEQAINEGNEARDKNKYTIAVVAYERVTRELDPKDARAYYGLGNVYSDLSCKDSAIVQYREALGLKNDFRDAHISLGYAYASKERFDEAEQQFREVLNKNNKDASASLGLAFLSWKRKKPDDAISQLRLIAENLLLGKEDRAMANSVIGDIYLEQQKWQEAAAKYDEAILLNPAPAGFYLKRGQVESLHLQTQYAGYLVEELKPEDREKVIKASQKAIDYFHRGIDEHDFKHPLGYLFLAYGLSWQSNYSDAASNVATFFAKLKELENQVPSVAKGCANGFDPLSAKGHVLLGLMHMQQAQREPDKQKKGDLFNSAAQDYLEAVKRDGNDSGSRWMLGLIYRLQGRYSEAIEQYERALGFESDEKKKANLYVSIGDAYSALGRDADAIDYINRGVAIRPEAIYYSLLANLYRRQGNYDEAIKLFRKYIDSQPQTPHSYDWLAGVYFQRARQKGNAADYEEAIASANKALQIDRTYASAYRTLGNVYRFYKDGALLDKAIANYELALQYNPKDPITNRILGNLYLFEKQNDDAAIKYLKGAISLSPDYADAYYDLARAHRHKHDDAEAIAQLQNAIKYDEKYLGAYLDLAAIYDEQKNYEEAMKWLRTAMEKFPLDYMPYKELARVYSNQQKNEEAIHYYEEAISRMKESDSFLREVFRCRIERLRGRYAEAITCVQKIKLSASDDPAQIVYEIGLTYVAGKDKKAALAQYDQLKQKKSTLADLLLRQINEMK